MHPITESIDHVEYSIGMSDDLPDWWEHRDREEDSTEICQRREDKIRYDRRRVEAICHESVQESDECEEQ